MASSGMLGLCGHDTGVMASSGMLGLCGHDTGVMASSGMLNVIYYHMHLLSYGSNS